MKPAAWTLSFPTLLALGLSAEQLAILARNGSLRAENRGQGKAYYRLRFRKGTKQCTCYVGKQMEFVDQVREELKRLQGKIQSRRQLRRLAKEARVLARNTKCLLEPLLPDAGRVFHGRAIRRRRLNRSDRDICLE
jgi:hypothetical protein